MMESGSLGTRRGGREEGEGKGGVWGRGGGGRGGREEGHADCAGGCSQAPREEPGERWSARGGGAVRSWGGEEEGACSGEESP